MTGIPELARLIDKIDAILSALPKRDETYDYEQWKACRRAEDEAVSRLVAEENGRFNHRGDARHLKLAGLSTSCTAGSFGLMRNWQASARRRIAKMKEQHP